MKRLRFESPVILFVRAGVLFCLLVVSFLPQGAGQTLAAHTTVQNFDVPNAGSRYVLGGVSKNPQVMPGGPAGSTNMLRLAFGSGPAHQGIVAFDRTSPARELVVAEFDFRITVVTGRADGLGFALLNTAHYGPTGLVLPQAPLFAAEEPNYTGSLGVGFDVYMNTQGGDVSANHVSIHFNGARVEQFDLPPELDLASGEWIRARIVMRPGGGHSDVSVLLTEPGAAPVKVVDRFEVPGFVPYHGRVHLAARSGGLFAHHDVDNIRVTYLERQVAPADFDGDGDTDLSVYRPSQGFWYVRDQFITKWGIPGDVPVPGDYDGDGDADLAIYRPSQGMWYVKDQFITKWGIPGDIPVPGDYNADGRIDLAVYRPSTGTWFVRNLFLVGCGAAGDIPLPGDYDGDEDADIETYRPSDGMWRCQSTVQHGTAGDIPVPGDYDGDGFTDFAVYRPSNGTWYIRNQFHMRWGIAGDIPVPGDYDGDWDTDIAIYRPSQGLWYVKDQFILKYGLPGDFPLPARDTNGDGDPQE